VIDMYFDPEGHLVMPEALSQEAICPECEQKIRWVLDMASFTTKGPGGHMLAHARCVWTPNAFTVQRRAAKEIQG
jgi:hypothetical protein